MRQSQRRLAQPPEPPDERARKRDRQEQSQAEASECRIQERLAHCVHGRWDHVQWPANREDVRELSASEPQRRTGVLLAVDRTEAVCAGWLAGGEERLSRVVERI